MEVNKKASNFSKIGNTLNPHVLTECGRTKQLSLQPSQQVQASAIINQQQSATDLQSNGNCGARNSNVNINNSNNSNSNQLQSKKNRKSLRNSGKRRENFRPQGSGKEEVVQYQNFPNQSIDLNSDNSEKLNNNIKFEETKNVQKPSSSNKGYPYNHSNRRKRSNWKKNTDLVDKDNNKVDHKLQENLYKSNTHFVPKVEENGGECAGIDIYEENGGDNDKSDNNDKDNDEAYGGTNVEQKFENCSTQPSTSAHGQYQSVASTTGLVTPGNNNECAININDAITDGLSVIVDTMSSTSVSFNNGRQQHEQRQQQQQNRRGMQYRRHNGDQQRRDISNDLQCVELNSVYSPGCKKQSLNHLLNFYYTPVSGGDYLQRVEDNNGCLRNVLRGTSNNNDYSHSTYKFSKEQFIQANFQFVINWSMQNKIIESVDTLVEWSLIEQINVHTNEEMQCPICLYPPVAAKMTCCGHVYCWSCILHYLALSDRNWRKCPICFDVIHVDDLKSVIIIKHETFEVGSEIRLQLMCRKKGTNRVEKINQITEINDKVTTSLPSTSLASSSPSYFYPWLSSSSEESKRFSKYLIAKRKDVLDILQREEKELLDRNYDVTCAEFFFVEQALDLLRIRRDSIRRPTTVNHNDEKFDNITEDKTISYKMKSDENKLVQRKVLTEKDEFEIIQNFVKDEISSNPRTIGIYESTENLNEYIEVTCDDDSKEGDNDSNDDEGALKFLPDDSMDGFYYFYQSVDGQNIFLHPLNVKMLQACYGNLFDGPHIVHGRIVQIEQYSMNDDHRRRYTCLSHLPLTCQFAIVEIHLSRPYVTDKIAKLFHHEIIKRKQQRQKRARIENEHDRRIAALNDRKLTLAMQAHDRMYLNESSLASNVASSNEFHQIDLQSTQQFPICGSDSNNAENIQASSIREQLPHSSRVNNLPENSMATRSKRTVERQTKKQSLLNPVNTKIIHQTNSSNGNCSYSAMALHCQQVQAPWTVISNPSSSNKHVSNSSNKITGENSNEEIDEKGNYISTKPKKKTNLGDVIAQALSEKTVKSSEKTQKGYNNAASVNANTNDKATNNQNHTRKKKNKKGISIYMSGMQFNPNN